MVYYLFQVITQSDLGGNQLSIQPLLHGINLQDKLTEYNFLYFNTKKPQNIISKIFHF